VPGPSRAKFAARHRAGAAVVKRTFFGGTLANAGFRPFCGGGDTGQKPVNTGPVRHSAKSGWRTNCLVPSTRWWFTLEKERWLPGIYPGIHGFYSDPASIAVDRGKRFRTQSESDLPVPAPNPNSARYKPVLLVFTGIRAGSAPGQVPAKHRPLHPGSR
jgi:hypothetical protein